MKKLVCLFICFVGCCDLFAQADSFYSPVEYKKVYFYNDGTYFIETYEKISEDTTERKEAKIKSELKYDSMFKAEFMKQLPKFNEGKFQIRKFVGVQILGKLDRKSKEKFRAAIRINEKKGDTIDVDFNIKDTLFKEFTPIYYHPTEDLYKIMLCVFSDSLLKDGAYTNAQGNYFVLVSIFYEEELNHLLTYLQKRYMNMYDYFKYDTLLAHNWRGDYQYDQLDTSFIGRYMMYDSVKKDYFVKRQYVLNPRVLNTRTGEVFYFLFSQLPEGAYLEYKIVPWLPFDESNIPWQKNPMGSSLLKISFPEPGNYFLRVRNAHFPKWSFMQEVTVHPRWFQTEVFKISSIVFICGMILLLLFRNYRKRQRRKLKQMEQEKDEVSINLQSVRSQLNPHFIFNALSSIQGLISTQKYEKANEYLVSFSKMLRKPMDPAELKHWNLADEVSLLQEYIKIEQLRKEFYFELHIDEDIETTQINFPALILQPVVENAIKHGLQGGPGSLLLLSFKKIHRALEVRLKDKGPGFDTSLTHEGKGLHLTREYIALVNKQFTASKIEMLINTDPEGTELIFTFQNWLDES